MKQITQHYAIKAPLEKVWAALVDPKEIEGWGGGPAKMDDQIGTEFSLWGGDIHGKNIEVEKNAKLVQEWYGGDWNLPSIASFILREQDGITQLDFIQTDVPDDAFEDIEKGWEEFYLGPLKDYCEKQ